MPPPFESCEAPDVIVQALRELATPARQA